ncbi:MAG: hypothetical protein VB021_09870 [Oscillospiraceae bacterium]|nr:hypothetical protein [Oscillospiraceae bacterium]
MKKWPTAHLLPLAAGILYALIVAGDLFGARIPFSGAVKLAGVALCAAGAGLLARAAPGRRARLVFLAAALTVGADVFLLFFPALYVWGLLFFCAAQTARLALFAGLTGRRTAALCAAQAAAFALLRAGGLPGVIAAGGVYALLLLANLLLAFARPDRCTAVRRLRRAGMTLFALCDVCVALYNLLPAVPLRSAAGALMWTFYLPSQLLLAAEGHTDLPEARP